MRAHPWLIVLPLLFSNISQALGEDGFFQPQDGCSRFFVQNGATHPIDSGHRQDGEGLRPAFKSNPEAERLLNEYQSSLKSPNWPAYVGTLGLVMTVGGIIAAPSMHPRRVGQRNIRYAFTGTGVGIIVGSYIWGQQRRIANEETLNSAIAAYNSGIQDSGKRILRDHEVRPSGPNRELPFYTAAVGAAAVALGVAADSSISSSRVGQRNFRLPLVTLGSAAIASGFIWGMVNDLNSPSPNPDWPIYTGAIGALTAIGGSIAANNISQTSVGRRNLRLTFITVGAGITIGSLIWGISTYANPRPTAETPEKVSKISWGMGVDPFTSSGQIQAEVPL